MFRRYGGHLLIRTGGLCLNSKPCLLPPGIRFWTPWRTLKTRYLGALPCFSEKSRLRRSRRRSMVCPLLQTPAPSTPSPFSYGACLPKFLLFFIANWLCYTLGSMPRGRVLETLQSMGVLSSMLCHLGKEQSAQKKMLHRFLKHLDPCSHPVTDAFATVPMRWRCFLAIKCFRWSCCQIFQRLEWPSSLANLFWGFQPHTHSWCQARIFSTNKPHPYSCLSTATWAHEKRVPRNCPIKFSNKFLRTLQKVVEIFDSHGSKQRKGTTPKNLSWNQLCYCRKTQVSAIFLRTVPGIETASSWVLCHARGQGGGGGGA